MSDVNKPGVASNDVTAENTTLEDRFTDLMGGRDPLNAGQDDTPEVPEDELHSDDTQEEVELDLGEVAEDDTPVEADDEDDADDDETPDEDQEDETEDDTANKVLEALDLSILEEEGMGIPVGDEIWSVQRFKSEAGSLKKASTEAREAKSLKEDALAVKEAVEQDRQILQDQLQLGDVMQQVVWYDNAIASLDAQEADAYNKGEDISRIRYQKEAYAKEREQVAQKGQVHLEQVRGKKLAHANDVLQKSNYKYLLDSKDKRSDAWIEYAADKVGPTAVNNVILDAEQVILMEKARLYDEAVAKSATNSSKKRNTTKSLKPSGGKSVSLAKKRKEQEKSQREAQRNRIISGGGTSQEKKQLARDAESRLEARFAGKI